MVNLKNVYYYWRQYGTQSLVGLVWEKLIIDSRRFSGRNKQTMPKFAKPKVPPFFDDKSDKDKTLCYLIHYFYPTKKGGTERFTLNLAEASIRGGNRAFIITLGKLPLKEYLYRIGDIYYRTYEYKGVPVIEMRHRRAPAGLYYKNVDSADAAIEVFARHIIELGHVDVVHATYPQPFAPFLKVCREKNVPYVVTLTDFALLCHYTTMVDKKGFLCGGSQCGKLCEKRCSTYGVKSFLGRYNKAAKLMENACLLSAPSEFVANIFENEFPGIRVDVIPHGIGEAFQCSRKRAETRHFMYAGTLSPLKGIHLLIQAFCNLDGDMVLDIYGDGDGTYRSKLERIADKRVVFHGAASEDMMPELYNKAECVIVSSLWYETYNFVIREALACGCIVVASRIGALPEVVSEGKNGFLFEPGNPEDLKRALAGAQRFDWNEYRTSIFPTKEEEYRKYEQIY